MGFPERIIIKRYQRYANTDPERSEHKMVISGTPMRERVAALA